VRARAGATTAAVALSLSLSTPARSSGPIGPQGSAITTSSYKVDFFQGPVLASSRITALAGAYVALAELSDGNPYNPASPAIRVPYSILPTDYDLTGSFTLPASLSATDFYNSGTKGFAYNDFVFLTGGGNLQHSHWGLGATLNFQIYNLTNANLPSFSGLQLSLATGHVLAAYGFFDDQFYAGVGARIVSLTANGSGLGSRTLLSMSGAGFEAGVVWAPRPFPFRLGVAGRSPVDGNPEPTSEIQPNAQGDTLAGPLFIPSSIVLPWEIEAGVAVQFGPRPLNLSWTDRRRVTDAEIEAERQANPPPAGGEPENRNTTAARILERRYEAIPRQQVLVTTSLLLTGPVSDAVGVESFLSQKVDRSGQTLSVTPRLGVESEVVPYWLRVRAGSYYEPTRFSNSSPRLHGTFGVDAKVFSWSVFGLFQDWTAWRLGGMVDGARDYLGWSISVGLWH
jgi:hypothetical protein